MFEVKKNHFCANALPPAGITLLYGVQPNVVRNTNAVEPDDSKELDLQLFQRLRRRDRASLQDLIERYGTALARAAYLCLGDAHAAEDVAQSANADNGLARIRDELRRMMSQARSRDVISNVEANRSQVSELHRAQGALEIDLVAKQVRLEAVSARIATLADEAGKASPKQDPIAQQLEKIVALREEELKATHGTGRQEQPASLRLAEAKVQLALRREAARNAAADPEILAKLKTEQITLWLDIVELRARQRAIGSQLGRCATSAAKLQADLAKSTNAAWNIEQVKTVDLPLAMKRYERAALRLMDMRQELQALIPPKVTLLKTPGSAEAARPGKKPRPSSGKAGRPRK